MFARDFHTPFADPKLTTPLIRRFLTPAPTFPPCQSPCSRVFSPDRTRTGAMMKPALWPDPATLAPTIAAPCGEPLAQTPVPMRPTSLSTQALDHKAI